MTGTSSVSMACQTLHGSCACGRIRYVVEIPEQQSHLVELRYDNTSASRHTSASPLTLWLRVPLTWFTSATFAQFPDETRASIQRTFVSPSVSSSTRRQFCGYCGTQLTSWHERTRDDADHICLTIGSLLDEDQATLGQLGLLPGGDTSDEDTANVGRPSQSITSRSVARTEPRSRGAPWFEEIVGNTTLGQLKQQRGGHSSSDGNVHVEWEVMEWSEGDEIARADHVDTSASIKRKIGEVDGDHIEMQTL